MAIGIHCCKSCVPPKRHRGCHAECKEYLEEKAQLEEDKKSIKANRTPSLSIYDFNETDYIKCRRRKWLNKF